VWVCGKPEVDFELLKRHTRYTGNLNETKPLIKNFWEILKDMSEKDKLRYIFFFLKLTYIIKKKIKICEILLGTRKTASK